MTASRTVGSLLFLAALLLVGCVTTGTGRLPAPAPSVEGALGANDVLEIRVLQEPEISGIYRLDATGNLAFPYVGTVKATGLSPESVASELDRLLADGGFFHDPVVTVFVKEFNSRQVYVLGSVKNPGSYSFRDGMGVIDAISAAGGVLETGQASKTTVTRKVDGVEHRVVVAVPAIVNGRAPDQSLAVGDIVFVPESPI